MGSASGSPPLSGAFSAMRASDVKSTGQCEGDVLRVLRIRPDCTHHSTSHSLCCCHEDVMKQYAVSIADRAGRTRWRLLAESLELHLQAVLDRVTSHWGLRRSPLPRGAGGTRSVPSSPSCMKAEDRRLTSSCGCRAGRSRTRHHARAGPHLQRARETCREPCGTNEHAGPC